MSGVGRIRSSSTWKSSRRHGGSSKRHRVVSLLPSPPPEPPSAQRQKMQQSERRRSISRVLLQQITINANKTRRRGGPSQDHTTTAKRYRATDPCRNSASFHPGQALPYGRRHPVTESAASPSFPYSSMTAQPSRAASARPLTASRAPAPLPWFCWLAAVAASCVLLHRSVPLTSVLRA